MREPMQKQFKRIVVDDAVPQPVRPRTLAEALTGLATAFGATVDVHNPLQALDTLTRHAEHVTAVFTSTNDRLEKVERLIEQGSTLQQQTEFWKRDAEKARLETKRANETVLRFKGWYHSRYGRDMDTDVRADERHSDRTIPKRYLDNL